jgi:hypothetical protein
VTSPSAPRPLIANAFPVELAAYSKKSTISSREIQTSVRLILPGELAKHAISEGTKSVTKVRCFISVRSAASDLFPVLERSGEVNLPVDVGIVSHVMHTCTIYLATSLFSFAMHRYSHITHFPPNDAILRKIAISIIQFLQEVPLCDCDLVCRQQRPSQGVLCDVPQPSQGPGEDMRWS